MLQPLVIFLYVFGALRTGQVGVSNVIDTLLDAALRYGNPNRLPTSYGRTIQLNPNIK